MTRCELAHCQLGYRPTSPKSLTLVPQGAVHDLPERIPFYLRDWSRRLPRDQEVPEVWQGRYFRWPFDISEGKLRPDSDQIRLQGELLRLESRWGPFWQGDFDAFEEQGNFQIETDFGNTFPICIQSRLYDRIQRGYLNFLYCQRSGMEIPGIRPAEHLDDGVLDSTGEQINAVGGWYDAGDLRKWLFLTQPNLQSLAELAERGHPAFREPAIDEIQWGNRFFHSMITDEGQVWEDLAGGAFKPGLNYDEHWWYENHPGCNCGDSDCRYTDNQPGTGDERFIRTTYNPAVQFMFVRTQARVAPLLDHGASAVCRGLADRAWSYGRQRRHDQRTLFVAEELWAGLELLALGSAVVSVDEVRALAKTLLGRIHRGDEGLSHFFIEKDGADGFRSVALGCEPGLALLRMVELAPEGLEAEKEAAIKAISEHIDRYLLADAVSNPFQVTPYGVYIDPPMREHQTFREAGGGRGVRTFVHPFSAQQIVHGTGGVIMHQAALLAKAGNLLQRPEWKTAAERLIQWTHGHNPESLCLHTGVGFRHPTPFSGYVTQIPDAICVGHIGRPDDQPYLETSALIEWSTQEIWDIPHAYLCEAVLWLD